ncbi:MAG TPA: addiction module protein [Kofleriaceae bacterium]|nr:addiction module protein [Kofleriaceae bacterium]
MAHKEEHLAALLDLTPDERLEAANILLDSLDAESGDPEWETRWAEELQRRLAGLQDGSRQPAAAAEVFAEARSRLGAPTR